jgi:DNA-directed RNA polymerase specialized sigma24 family protein
MVESCLGQVGEPAKTILELYYYHGMSMEEIAQKLNYKNADTAKNLKYKSLIKLKKIFQNRSTTFNSNKA